MENEKPINTDVKCICPNCKSQIEHVVIDKDGKQKKRKVIYPVWENGKFNWKNAFRIDPVMFLMIIAILLILFGCYQINQQCYKIIEKQNQNQTLISSGYPAPNYYGTDNPQINQPATRLSG